MADIPGRVGWPLLGDKSLEFAKDPIKFFEKYTKEANSLIFASRFLNKPTVFVGSNAGVAQVLQGEFCVGSVDALSQLLIMYIIYYSELLVTD